MKRNTLSLLLLILLLFRGTLQSDGQIQSINPPERFYRYIKNYNLKFTLPNDFFEADTIREDQIYPFLSKPAPANRNYINVENMVFSADKKVMIIWSIISLTRQAEANARLIFKDHDSSRNYFARLRGTIGSNQGVRAVEIELRDKDILYYGKKELKRLGAEVAGEYTIKLTEPYLDYTYLTYRFIVIPYHLDIYTYIFYKEYSEELAKKITKKTKYILRFR
jgi:DUF971 family protein